MSSVPTLKSTIQRICKKYRIYPSKRLGQNFLINKLTIKKVVLAADLSPSDIVLEIGPGIGNLTQELAKRAKKVIAVEKDPRMIDILRETLKNFRNIEVMQRDILKIQNAKCKSQNENEKFKIIGNIPFYLTAPVIRKFLESEVRPELMVFIVQKEVAQRIVAKPPKMNLLPVSVQFYAQPKIIDYVSKNSFWPKPKVDSAIIKISNLKTQNSKLNKDLFFRIVRSGFSQPRKQLANNLSKKLKLDKVKVSSWLLKNNIKPEQRAEALTIENWISLAKTLNDEK
jgi:16S rRNA (adenine1518-N6/adenine1519-N6)-dimethyltransferase